MSESVSESCIVVGRNPCRRYKGKIKHYDIGRRKGDCYAAFYGIPYGKILGGRLKRYQAPLPLFSGPTQSFSTYEANITHKHCTQSGLVQGQTTLSYFGSSDCLYLNIFVPEKPELIKELLPVLVYIHGGGFSYGSNDYKTHTPDSIVQQGVVFVTINYRLGIFGFLNLRTPDCPGNAGLKDQVRALEWIRDNIECFKGDPNNVTISGSSAGATCVNLHLISPASKDLFHKAIVQSGGVHTPWGYRGHRIEQKRILYRDSKFWQLSNNVEEESYELHKYVDALLANDHLKRHPQTISPTLGPSVEKFKRKAFLPDNLEELMKNVQHDKPVMAGITKGEGTLPFIICRHFNYSDVINNDHIFIRFLMDNLRWSSETAGMIMEEIRNKYFPNRFEQSDDEQKICFSNFMRDLFFRRFYNNFRFGSEKAVHKNLYVYRFDHFSQICQTSYSEIDPFCDPTHGDDLKYLQCPEFLKTSLKPFIYEGPEQNREIQEVIDRICSLWANFCKTGVPKSDYDPDHVEWRRHTEESPCYMIISNNLELKEEALFQDEWSWWNERIDSQATVDSLPTTPESEEE